LKCSGYETTPSGHRNIYDDPLDFFMAPVMGPSTSISSVLAVLDRLEVFVSPRSGQFQLYNCCDLSLDTAIRMSRMKHMEISRHQLGARSVPFHAPLLESLKFHDPIIDLKLVQKDMADSALPSLRRLNMGHSISTLNISQVRDIIPSLVSTCHWSCTVVRPNCYF